MAMKKYAFLSLALLTSMSKAFFDEESCFKFYVGGDLGMGIFSANLCATEINETDQNDVDAFNISFSSPVFIGGGRVGLAWTGSECWYAAIEGNIHSASRTACSSIRFESDNPSYSSVNFQVKSSFIAGVHAHLGYRAVEDGAAYAIIGYKYLRTNNTASVDFRELNDISVCQCFNNNGWVAGIGGLWNLECNWDLRLEVLYSQFSNKCYDSVFTAKVGELEFTRTVSNTYRPRLFYGVVSLAYNF